jgi:hypothetical protein
MDRTLQQDLYEVTRERRAIPAKMSYDERSAQRLLTISSKKITTTMIGCINEIEKVFGHIWGHGKKLSDLSERERQWYDIWQQLRKNVLNLGNKQIRALQNEIDEYSISWNRHEYILPVRKRS